MMVTGKRFKTKYSSSPNLKNAGKEKMTPAFSLTDIDSAASQSDDANGASKGVVGNVCKLLVVPSTSRVLKNKNGMEQELTKRESNSSLDTAPKKGQLIFDASFESGNLGRVDCISANEYDLFLRPDTCNPKYRLWFHFTVENGKANQRVILNIVNFSKIRSSYQEGMTPVVRVSTQQNWQRLPAHHVTYYKSPHHEERFVLSFAFVFTNSSDVYHFAYCYPYSYSDLQRYLLALEKKNMPYFRRDVLVRTVQRRLDLLTITDAANFTVSNKQRIIFITARVHPGETPASFVCQGLIDFLLSSDPAAEALRKVFVFKIVPMLNPDGVALGNYRCSLMGFDLNRHWQVPSSWAHPTVHATKNMLLQYNKNTQMELVLYLDLHAHSTRKNAFFYGNVFSKDKKRCEKQLVLPILLSKISDDFSLQSTQFNTDNIKAGTGRRTMGGSLNTNCLCYTMEVSFFGYESSRAKAGEENPPMQYISERYKRLGRNVALAILEFSLVESGQKEAPSLPRPFNTFVPQKSGQNQTKSSENKMILPHEKPKMKKAAISGQKTVLGKKKLSDSKLKP